MRQKKRDKHVTQNHSFFLLNGKDARKQRLNCECLERCDCVQGNERE